MGPTIPNLFKHRDGCGKIQNHVRLVQFPTLLDDDEEESLGEEEAEQELERIGDGEYPMDYQMTWIDHDENPGGIYEYIVMSHTIPKDEEEALDVFALAVAEENEKRRQAKQEEFGHPKE